jgi:hypothetical protein
MVLVEKSLVVAGQKIGMKNLEQVVVPMGMVDLDQMYL